MRTAGLIFIGHRLYSGERPGGLKINISIALFLMAMNASILAVSYQFGQRLGLFVGLVFALLTSGFLLWNNESRIIKRLSAKRIEGSDAWGLNTVFLQLAMKRRWPTPEVWVFEHDCPISFCTGSVWDENRVLISTSLLKKLSDTELKTLAALCLSFIQLKNEAWKGPITRLLLVFGSLSRTLGKATLVPVVTNWLAAPFLKTISWLLVNPSTYAKADRLTASLLEEEIGLARLLVKLDAFAECHPMKVAPDMVHMLPVQTLTNKSDRSYVSKTHRVEQRIRKLVGYYPI